MKNYSCSGSKRLMSRCIKIYIRMWAGTVTKVVATKAAPSKRFLVGRVALNPVAHHRVIKHIKRFANNAVAIDYMLIKRIP